MSAASMTISSSRAMDSHLPKVGESFIGFCECRGAVNGVCCSGACFDAAADERILEKLVASHCDES
jgi:hypothetical protein